MSKKFEVPVKANPVTGEVPLNDDGVPMKTGIVEAVGTSAVAANMTKAAGLSRRYEEAMAAAITQCYEEGITDPDTQREKMQEARRQVKKDIADEMEAARLKALADADAETEANRKANL